MEILVIIIIIFLVCKLKRKKRTKVMRRYRKLFMKGVGAVLFLLPLYLIFLTKNVRLNNGLSWQWLKYDIIRNPAAGSDFRI